MSLLDDITVEIERPGPGFVLSRSTLGTPLGGTLKWSDILPDATSVAIRRGGKRDGLTTTIDVGTCVITLLDAADPTTDPDIHPNAPLRVRLRDAPATVLFTGRIADVTMDEQHNGTRIVTITATDAVSALANTMRYGAASGTNDETWVQRVHRLLAQKAMPYTVIPPAPDVILDVDLNTAAADEATAEAAKWTGGYTAVAGLPPGEPTRFLAPSATSGTARRTITGLTPGQAYEVAVSCRYLNLATGSLTVEGRTDPYTWIGANEFFWISVVFTATAAEHTVSLPIRPSATPDIGGIRVTRDPSRSAFLCADIVYESTLLNHLTLATTTGFAAWYVNRDDVVIAFEPTPTEPVVELSDVPSPSPQHRSYTAATITYDTRAIVTDLSLSNHARTVNDDGDPVADDRALGPYVNVTAAATWGDRAAAVETCLVLDDTDHLTAGAADAWVSRVLPTRSEPALLISQVVLNITDDAGFAAQLDIYSAVTVTRRDLSHAARVIGLEYTIAPTKWLVTLDLLED